MHHHTVYRIYESALVQRTMVILPLAQSGTNFVVSPATVTTAGYILIQLNTYTGIIIPSVLHNLFLNNWGIRLLIIICGRIIRNTCCTPTEYSVNCPRLKNRTAL